MTHLLIVGFDEIVSNKYMSCIEEATREGRINGYSVLDLKREEGSILARVAKNGLRPASIQFIDNPDGCMSWADRGAFEPAIARLHETHGHLKVYIATELKAHEAYLSYCVENGIDSLVEKPIFAPMLDGRFAPKLITSRLAYLLSLARRHKAQHSVMTLSRYHRIYNDIALASTRDRVLRYAAPATSFHLRTAGGVWNLHREYESREDHPYKYGYGMIMHGAYHYIDLSAQFLALNRLALPTADFSLSLVCYAAFPGDQVERVPRTFSEAFDDYDTDWSRRNSHIRYGETDVTATFCRKDEKTGRAVTVGTISLEQTTPSIRCWKDMPPGLYNKNGRIFGADLEVQLSTLHAMNVKSFDVPVWSNGSIERVDLQTQVSTRSNALMMNDELFNETMTFEGLNQSDSNRSLMRQWLRGTEKLSRLEDHLATMQLTQSLCEAVPEPSLQVQTSLAI